MFPDARSVAIDASLESAGEDAITRLHGLASGIDWRQPLA